jgi:5-methylcytosine-specific restriction enzyme subunit McrC
MLDVPIAELLSEGQLDLDAAAAGRYFTLQLSKKQLRLQARGFIGFIPINERIAVDVIPRCPIANLAHILRVAGFAPAVIETSARRYALDPTELPDLRDFYAAALLTELAAIQAYGRLREYRERIERTSAPRGRLLLGAPETQLAAAGWSVVTRCSWFERTADTAANRCLKLAIWLLAHAYGQSSNLTARQRRLALQLNAAFAQFEDAALDPRLGFLSDSLVVGTAPLPGTRAYYRNALDLARLVVESSSLAFDRPGADVRMPSVVIAMETVFERYVRTVLADTARRGLPLRVLDGNAAGSKPLYDTLPSEPATPDVVFVTANGSTPLVLEVKYKPASGAPERPDLNQVITYGASYRARNAVIVQPRAHGSPRNGLLRLGDIDALQVSQYVVDLAGDLEAEEAALAAALFGLASSGEPE